MADAASEEKTEAPSQKRREDSRKEGQVAFSKEISAVALLGGFLLLFYFIGPMIIQSYLESFRFAFQSLSVKEIDISTIQEYVNVFLNSSVIIAIPFFLTAIVVGVLASVAQVGVHAVAAAAERCLGEASGQDGLRNDQDGGQRQQ